MLKKDYRENIVARASSLRADKMSALHTGVQTDIFSE
jgi:hypothetical protein